MKKSLYILCLNVLLVQYMYAQNNVIAHTDYLTVFKNEATILRYMANDIIDSVCMNNTPVIASGDKPLHGTITQKNSTITYTPTKDFLGQDSLIYTISCNGKSSRATVYINVVEMPDNIDPAKCVVIPPADTWSFKMLEKSTDTYTPYFSNLVGDVDSDGHIEIFAVANENHSYRNFYFLDASTTGLPKKYSFTVADGSWFSHDNAVSFADVDRDGYAEIFYTAQNGYLYCLQYDKVTKTYPSGNNYKYKVIYNQKNSWHKDPKPMIVDFNADGIPEVVVYDRIYNAVTGDLIVDGDFKTKNWNCGLGTMHKTNENNSAPNCMAIGDIDNDGYPEVAAGDMVYKVHIVSLTDPTLNSITLYKQCASFTGIGDGATALVDINLDGYLDVVVIRRINATAIAPYPSSGTATVFVWDPRLGHVIHTNAITDIPINGTWGGPSIPLIADMDGDGYPEIGLSSYCTLRTYKLDTATNTLNEMWRLGTSDGSASTGLTLFDFNLDGKSELVYRDETVLRILNGSDGKTLTSIANSSCTASEYPVVADVNNDGAAEIIVTGWPSGSCSGTGYVSIYSSNPVGKWAPARKVWNQYVYNTVNINEDLTVPKRSLTPATVLIDPNNVIRRPYNCYLQQATVFDRYGKSIYPASDVFATDIKTIAYNNDSIVVKMNIVNQGSVKLQSPFKITIYRDSIGGTSLYTATISEEIASDSLNFTVTFTVFNPMQYQPFEKWVYSLNDGGSGVGQNGGEYNECDTTNNYMSIKPLIAVNDNYVGWINESITISPLSNDSKGECSSIQAILLQQPRHGSLQQIIGSKNYTYTPKVNYFGLDSIRYMIVCQGDTAIADINIVVVERPDNIQVANCVLIPDSTQWGIEAGDVSDITVHSYAQPLSGDVDGDGHNEIVTVGADGGSHYSSSTIVVLDDQLKRKQVFTVPTMSVYGCYPVAIGDVDKDGQAEIFILASTGYLYCYDWQGTQKWQSDIASSTAYQSSLSIADINNDGIAEVLTVNMIYNGQTGISELELPCNVGYSKPYNGVSSMPVISDMDNDGVMEVVGGNVVLKISIQDASDRSKNSGIVWKEYADGSPRGTGFTSVADIDLDGYMDVIVVRGGQMYAWKPYSGINSIPSIIGTAPSGGSLSGSAGSRALVADIDADGYPEIAWTYANRVQAYDYNPLTKTLEMKWQKSTSDGSGATTMSVFDFNQDGSAELVYRDESNLRIMDGITGENTTSISCSSGTAVEYPIIVDLDRDGSAEIVVSGNGPKILSFRSPSGQSWAPARYVWNQHGYNVLHVNNDLTIPQIQMSPATVMSGADKQLNTSDDVRPFNNFLQQATLLDTNGVPMFVASDLTYRNLYTVSYGEDSVIIYFTLENNGEALCKSPIYISLYHNKQNSPIRIDTITQTLSEGSHYGYSMVLPLIDSFMTTQNIHIVLNSKGEGIAQNGNLQPECDTTNNTVHHALLMARVDTVIICHNTQSTEVDVLSNDIISNKTQSTLTVLTSPHQGSTRIQEGKILYFPKQFRENDSLYYRVIYQGDTAYSWVYIQEDKDVAVATDIIAKDVDACYNGPATLIASSTLTSPTYNWYSDASLTQYIGTGSPYIIPTVTEEKIYYVTVQNVDTCENKPYTGKEVEVHIHNNPPLIEVEQDVDFCDNRYTTLTLKTTGVSYAWDSGKPNDPNLYVTHYGKYHVWAKDEYECMNDTTIVIEICPCNLYTVNAFSPNGDGINDTYKPKGNGDVVNMIMTIYDRWGVRVYRHEGLDVEWDGTFNGKECQAGVYYGVIEYQCQDHGDDYFIKSTSVTLLR